VAARPSGSRPHPSVGLIAGVLVAAGGYLLPWFKAGTGYGWWYSGAEYIRSGEGGGWTLWTIALLAVALVAAVWAGGSEVAAGLSVTAGIAAAVLAATAVAAGLVATGLKADSLDVVTQLPFSIGIPLMGVGFGLVVASGCGAIASGIAADVEERIRRRMT
jgi:hypothetical protein